MKYYISVGDTTKAFECSRDAFEAGKALGQAFSVIRVADGSLAVPVLYAHCSIVTYKGQSGRVGTMWNQTFCQ